MNLPKPLIYPPKEGSQILVLYASKLTNVIYSKTFDYFLESGLCFPLSVVIPIETTKEELQENYAKHKLSQIKQWEAELIEQGYLTRFVNNRLIGTINNKGMVYCLKKLNSDKVSFIRGAYAKFKDEDVLFAGLDSLFQTLSSIKWSKDKETNLNITKVVWYLLET